MLINLKGCYLVGSLRNTLHIVSSFLGEARFVKIRSAVWVSDLGIKKLKIIPDGNEGLDQ